MQKNACENESMQESVDAIEANKHIDESPT
jgi:hypothetical protein